jgi:SNF2 family DNA or RNA helicase
MRLKFRPHQKLIYSYTNKAQHPALFVDMRLGKTLVAVRKIKTYAKCNSVLIVAPYSAFDGWRKTLKAEYEGIPIELTEPASDAGWQLTLRFPMNKWFLINHSGFLRIPELGMYPWDVVVIDESTCLKAYTSKISKYFAKNFRNVKHRWVLTGLPDPESELDYFQQLKFLNPNVLGWDVRRFKMRYFVQTEHHQLFITTRGKKLLTDRLAKHCFFMSRKDAGYDIEKIYKRRIVKMPSEIKDIYDKIVDEFILETDEHFRMTKYAVTKFGWLRELCCGMVYKNETDKELIWPGKLELLEELVEGELKKTPLVIWCRYINDILNIQEKFSDKKLGIIYGKVKKPDRTKLINKFQNGKLDWLVIQPTTERFGADMSLTSTCIYYSTPLGLETRVQTEDRIIDIGKTESSLIIDLVVENSIEEKILKQLFKKNSRQETMKNIIKEMQRKV